MQSCIHCAAILRHKGTAQGGLTKEQDSTSRPNIWVLPLCFRFAQNCLRSCGVRIDEDQQILAGLLSEIGSRWLNSAEMWLNVALNRLELTIWLVFASRSGGVKAKGNKHGPNFSERFGGGDPKNSKEHSQNGTCFPCALVC